MIEPLVPAQLLRHTEVPGEGNLHVLGSFERRVTLWSQQHRALNLVYALHHERRLAAGTRVAIVGGGVAGLTAAAAATQKGAHVTLFEKQTQILHLLQGNHTRWVHPRIYDWPLAGSEDPLAGVPLLDWKAALAGEVAEQLLAGFHLVAADCRVHTGVEGLTVSVGPSPTRQLQWSGGAAEFDLVLFTVGFGIERTVDFVPPVSYWRDDSLHQPEVTSGVRSSLISGCGDGGLTDLLRVRITRFRHEEMVRDFVSGDAFDGLKACLREIERDLPGEPEATRSAWLVQRYDALPVPAAFDETLRARLRRDTRAVLNGPGAFPLDPGSAVLNRLLVWRLWRLDDVTYLPGKIAHVDRLGHGHNVHVDGQSSQFFDHVVIRHGAAPAVEGFPEIWRHREAFRALSKFDQTRFRMWPDGFYTAAQHPAMSSLCPPPPANPGA